MPTHILKLHRGRKLTSILIISSSRVPLNFLQKKKKLFDKNFVYIRIF